MRLHPQYIGIVSEKMDEGMQIDVKNVRKIIGMTRILMSVEKLIMHVDLV